MPNPKVRECIEQESNCYLYIDLKIEKKCVDVMLNLLLFTLSFEQLSVYK